MSTVKTALWALADLPRNAIIASSVVLRDACHWMQVSAAAAYYSTGVFVAERFWKLVAGASMIIAWLNLR